MRALVKFCLIATSLLTPYLGYATDISGKITAVQVLPEGLRFQLKGDDIIKSFCTGGWAGLNAFVPKSDSQYAFYYGQVMAAYRDNNTVYLGNIKAVGPAEYCDITKTGYGLLIFK